MATLVILCPTGLSSLPVLQTLNPARTKGFRPVRCSASSPHSAAQDAKVTRRSANYQPSVWDYSLLHSYTSDYHEERYAKQVERLKDDIKGQINGDMDPLAKLELIDSIQRLGLKYQFDDEIKNALDILYRDADNSWINEDLYAAALSFRLFRQNGYLVSKDVFERFKDEKGEFKKPRHEDVKTLLSLYEASFLGHGDEAVVDEAKAYATKNLEVLNREPLIPKSLARKIHHALDMPLHWNLSRIEARCFIDTYEQEEDKNLTLLQLAKLDYNIVQSKHLEEVKGLARWWVDMGLNKITFSRDRLLEYYLWSSGMIPEPKYEAFREMETMIVGLITLIDDVFDVYGSLEELELFTDFVNRWDITRIDELPPPMRTILLAMFNTSNEIGYRSIKEHGFNTIPYLSKAWGNHCKAYLKEAKWYHTGYKPTLEEYMSNASVSIGSPLCLITAYIGAAEKVTKEGIECIDKLPCMVRCSSTIVRLTNDLGTSKDELERGDNLKAIQCHMNEAGVSEEAAGEYIRGLVHETWKTMNKTMFGNYPFSEPFLSATKNLARAAHFFYKNGDGYGVNPGDETKGRLSSLLVLPVPV